MNLTEQIQELTQATKNLKLEYEKYNKAKKLEIYILLVFVFIGYMFLLI